MDSVRIKRTNITVKIRQLGTIIGYYAEHVLDLQDKIGEESKAGVEITPGLIHSIKGRIKELVKQRNELEDTMMSDKKLSNYYI